jgi:hypothetical protein
MSNSNQSTIRLAERTCGELCDSPAKTVRQNSNMLIEPEGSGSMPAITSSVSPTVPLPLRQSGEIGNWKGDFGFGQNPELRQAHSLLSSQRFAVEGQ